MLVRDVMTKDVITVPANTPIGDAKKLMKEHNVSRLPVVDDKGKLVGIVNEDRLESVTYSRSHAPVPWQIFYLLSKTTVKDVMVKEVATVGPDASVEASVAVAQRRGVGGLVVVDKDLKVLGIATTTDFFNSIINRVLGIGKPGIRLIIPKGGDAQSLQKIIDAVNKHGLEITTMFTISPPRTRRKDVIMHIDSSDVRKLVEELEALGFQPTVRER